MFSSQHRQCAKKMVLHIYKMHSHIYDDFGKQATACSPCLCKWGFQEKTVRRVVKDTSVWSHNYTLFHPNQTGKDYEVWKYGWLARITRDILAADWKECNLAPLSWRAICQYLITWKKRSSCHPGIHPQPPVLPKCSHMFMLTQPSFQRWYARSLTCPPKGSHL